MLRQVVHLVGLLALVARATAGEDLNPDRWKPAQHTSTNPPPASPAVFNPDPPGLPVWPAEEFAAEPVLELRVRISAGEPPRAPMWFNPDPGGRLPAKPAEPFFRPEFKPWPPYGSEPVELPRHGVRQVEVIEVAPAPPPGAAPEKFPLPRDNVRINDRLNPKWEDPEYFHQPAATHAAVDRWKVKFTPWQRYTDRPAETPYRQTEPAIWHPYKQSLLKGDAPIFGQDVFLNLTATSETVVEARRLPTPSGVSADDPSRAEFFGDGNQWALVQTLGFSLELFKGETVFQPVHWAIKIDPVYNYNHVEVEERNALVPNPAHRTERTRDFLTLQQYFGELHLADLSDNYDFCAVRVGSQPFNSDFRGFIFQEVNLGARFFGNADCNQWQYNVAAFPLREKETNSELNKFDARDQYVFLANLYRQDFLWKGYTAQVSFHANLDNGQTHYDENGNITRPSPLGTVREHDVHAYYIGWTGDGHIGRWNVSHAFYEAFGRDEFNGLAGRAADINAQMAALEVSYDRDWIRYKASFFYASGDDNAEDSTATGFDTIVDNPTFIGGPFSYYARQGFNLAGTAVALKQRNSLVPNLRTSKVEGQANFVNPGVMIFGLGTDIDVLPKLRSFINVNYIRFAETDTIKTALLTDQARAELGWDGSIGFIYRPLLNENIVLHAGFGVLLPGAGYRDIYKHGADPVPGLGGGQAGEPDDFLYHALCTLTLTY